MHIDVSLKQRLAWIILAPPLVWNASKNRYLSLSGHRSWFGIQQVLFIFVIPVIQEKEKKRLYHHRKIQKNHNEHKADYYRMFRGFLSYLGKAGSYPSGWIKNQEVGIANIAALLIIPHCRGSQPCWWIQHILPHVELSWSFQGCILRVQCHSTKISWRLTHTVSAKRQNIL